MGIRLTLGQPLLIAAALAAVACLGVAARSGKTIRTG